MKIHEYQAKEILREFGVPTPGGQVASNPAEVFDIARSFGGTVAVKAQIHAGGRGKGGGIHLAATPQKAESAAAKLLGRPLITPQTGSQGRIVRKVLVEPAVRIEREFYLGVLVDRNRKRPVLMASREGGIEIEEVAASRPELILKTVVDPHAGLREFQARKLGFGLGLEGRTRRKAGNLMQALYRAFRNCDASLVEINPMVLTAEGDLVALDAKMDIDDNALFRQSRLRAMRDYGEEDPLEIQASRYGLNYIKLDGYVGCMVNGAGLAMATMDIIKLAGGNPANFLDVGGGAGVEQVKNGFKILISDENVRAVLINIFGGIMRCDVVAQGVVEAVQDIGVKIPVVVRMEGTNVEEGRRILENSGLDFEVAKGMADAAAKVCARAAA